MPLYIFLIFCAAYPAFPGAVLSGKPCDPLPAGSAVLFQADSDYASPRQTIKNQPTMEIMLTIVPNLLQK